MFSEVEKHLNGNNLFIVSRNKKTNERTIRKQGDVKGGSTGTGQLLMLIENFDSRSLAADSSRFQLPKIFLPPDWANEYASVFDVFSIPYPINLFTYEMSGPNFFSDYYRRKRFLANLCQEKKKGKSIFKETFCTNQNQQWLPVYCLDAYVYIFSIDNSSKSINL